MDIASLGLELKSAGLAKGTNKLRELEGQSKRTEGAAAQLNRTLRSLATAAMAAVGTSLSVAGYIKLADAWSDMRSVIGAATRDMAGANDMMMRMVGIANASYAPLGQTAQIYSRNVGVLRELGYNANQAADFTEGLNHALTVTATKGERATSVQNALSKAMAVGKLQADGLETILANGGRLAETFAEELGTTVNGLRDMAAQGLITGRVMTDAVLNSLEKLREEAAAMPATISDGTQRIVTGLTALIGVFDQATGASGSLAGVLVSVGDALAAAAFWVRDNETVVLNALNALSGFGVVLRDVFDMATSALSALSQWVGGPGMSVLDWFQWATGAAVAYGAYLGGKFVFSVMAGAASLGVLKAALMATVVGAVVVGLGFVVGKFLELAQAVGGVSGALEHVHNVFGELRERIGPGITALYFNFKAFTVGLEVMFANAFRNILAEFASMTVEVTTGLALLLIKLNKADLANIVLGVGASVVAGVSEMGEATDALIARQEDAIRNYSALGAEASKAAFTELQSLKAINAVIDANRQRTSPLNPNDPSAPTGPTSPTNLVGPPPNDNSDAIKASQQTIAALQDEIDKLTLTEAAYRQLQVTKAWAMAPTQEMADLILMLGQQRDLTLEQVKAEELLKTAQTSLEDLQFELELLGMNNVERARAITLRDLERQGIVQGTEAWNQYGQAILDAAGALATANDNTRSTMEEAARGLSMLSRGFGDLASVMKDSVGEQSAVYKALFAAQHAFAIASSMASIQTAMAQALTLPPPANFMYMGIVAAEGASIIASIQALAGSFADGGYTGAGGKYDVAGLVHKGEVVWSQKDVARYGGWQNVDALRRGIMPAANDNGGGAGGVLHIKVTVDDEGHWAAYVNDAVGQGVNAAVTISDQRSKARMDSMQSEARRPVISARGAA